MTVTFLMGVLCGGALVLMAVLMILTVEIPDDSD